MVLLILPMLPAMLGQHAADAGDLTDGLSLGARDEVAHHLGDKGDVHILHHHRGG